MFIPEAFKVTDKKEIRAFLSANSFGQLISNLNGRPFSTHIPFLLNEDATKIFGHLARFNPQLKELNGQGVLVSIEGAHDYISPTWYVAKGVPTWNYQAAHIYGPCTLIEDAEQIRGLVNRLAEKYESSFENPWEPKYGDGMLRAILGFEIKIEEIQCKYKFSQNRSDEDRKNVVSQLRRLGSNRLAEEMERFHTVKEND